jgi:hypothetical protein
MTPEEELLQLRQENKELHERLAQRQPSVAWGQNGYPGERQAALDARYQYAMADPLGLAHQTRQAGVGSDRHLATLFMDGAYMNAFPALTSTPVSTVCAEPIRCGMGSPCMNRNSKGGRLRCMISWWIGLAAAEEWHQRGALCVPALEREEWVVRSFAILAAGFAAQPPPSRETVPKQRGRAKQSAAKNL